MHDTDYARGAESIEDAAYIDNECFDKNGDMRWGADYVMQEVKPFTARLRVVDVGHKTSYVWLADEAGRRYPMFLSDYVPLMTRAHVVDGLIEVRKYEPCKKTSAYGIRPAKTS